MSNRTNCKVKSDGSVCLKDILNSFNSPIREEHTWALCYQCAKYFSGCISSRKHDCYVVKEVEHVFLQTDGNIHENTTTCQDGSRKLLQNESDIIGSLGVVIYNTLSQGTDNGEERVISEELESLISDMIPDDASHHETDDEGIEQDSEEADEAGPSKVSTQITLDEIITRCEIHLGTLTKNQVEAHYKAVVRAFVAEAVELSMFLAKVEQGNITLPTNSTVNPKLTQLNFSDWAKFWVQVMSELRTGVKLKKVNYSKAPIEYELTPYEILMKDIRNCRYNLRKIMIRGDIPSRVTKDAHAIILEFIRSRPPLKKASDRKLPAQQKYITPREQLLNSIRKGRKLRPTPSPRTSRMLTNTPSTETSEEGVSKTRKLIKVDFSQFEDDDDDDISDSPEVLEPGLWSSEYSHICEGADATLEPYDLAIQELNSRTNVRRHTLGVFDSNLGCYSVPQSRPCSRQSCNSSEAESVQLEAEVAKQIQDDLTNAKTWEDSISLDDRLSLTLSEIVHIRSVLTKAELDALPAEGRIRHDVEARKVCFLCLKTRFGIFGPWGQRCTLCKRTICSKCCSKMNVPMEYFSTVPVVLLSPSIMATPEDELSDSFSRSLVNRMMESDSIMKKDSPSPDPNKPTCSMESSVISEPGSFSKFRTKANTVSRAVKVVDRLRASNQMVVCHDCKRMVLQIIKSARANRSAIRNKTIQNLTLNLSPIF